MLDLDEYRPTGVWTQPRHADGSSGADLSLSLRYPYPVAPVGAASGYWAADNKDALTPPPWSQTQLWVDWTWGEEMATPVWGQQSGFDECIRDTLAHGYKVIRWFQELQDHEMFVKANCIFWGAHRIGLRGQRAKRYRWDWILAYRPVVKMKSCRGTVFWDPRAPTHHLLYKIFYSFFGSV